VFERYSERAKQALFVARHNAFLDGSKFIEGHHLLHALLADNDATLRDVLAQLNVSTARVRTLLPPIPRIAGDPRHREIPFSEAFKQVLTFGAEEAATLNHVRIGTGHLVLGLLRAEGLAAHGPLTQSGVHIEAVRGLVIEAGRGLQKLISVRRRRENASLAVMALVIIAVVLDTLATGGITRGISPRGWGAIIVAVAGQFVFSAFNSRCPACDARLGRLIRTASFCPRCGIELTADERRRSWRAVAP
jgi:ATP-dependent Clp protease ATP-binding subunit ClpA